MQVDTWARGFSYAYDAPLDMRMDPDQELTAHEIVNTWDERRLARLLREYGEERYATQIARAIVRARAARGARLDPAARRGDQDRGARCRRSSPAGIPRARTFQALRIAVNDELAQLDAALPSAWEVLRPGRAVRGDLVPLARGPPGQAVPRRSRARLHLPAGASRSACAGTIPRPNC